MLDQPLTWQLSEFVVKIGAATAAVYFHPAFQPTGQTGQATHAGKPGKPGRRGRPALTIDLSAGDPGQAGRLVATFDYGDERPPVTLTVPVGKRTIGAAIGAGRRLTSQLGGLVAEPPPRAVQQRLATLCLLLVTGSLAVSLHEGENGNT